MKTFTDFLSTIFVFAIILVIGAGAYFFIIGVIREIGKIDAQLSGSVIAASVTAFAAVLTIIIGKYFENKARIQQELRMQKVKVYEKMINSLIRNAFSEKPHDQKIEDIVKGYRDLIPDLIVWGSNKVIKAWNEFRNLDWKSKSLTTDQMFGSYEKILREIRKDLGNSNKEFQNLELTRLFVNDLK